MIRPSSKPQVPDSKPVSKRNPARKDKDEPGDRTSDSRGRPLLEVDPSLSRKADIHNIVTAEGSKVAGRSRAVEEVAPSEGFVDDPDVPPLI